MTYRDSILADNPTHYWEYPPSGAQVFQDLGSLANPMISRAGALLGGYAGVWDGGMAAAYNGAARQETDTIEVLVAPYSFEVWCWLYSFNGLDSVLLNWAAGGVNGYGVHVDSTRRARVALDNLDIHDPAVLSLHAWHQLVATYGAGTATLYVDGASVVSSGGGGGLGAAADKLTLGSSVAGAGFVNGLLASPATFNYVLNAGQVAAHHAAANDRTVFPEFLGSGLGTISGAGGAPAGSESDILAAIYNAVIRSVP